MFPARPLKLIDCHVNGPDSGAELFIVEGDAASFAVANARNAATQAVLPMQGKPLNALRAGETKVRGYELFTALIEALGAGLGETFDLTKRRYDRVLLLMDPDADGIHCAALMQMFFYRWMRPLLEAACVEYVRAPLGEIRIQDASAPQYAYTEQQFFAATKALRERGAPGELAVRYRGLAAINADALAALCLDPATRRAQVIRARDAEMAIQVFGGG